MAAGGYRRLDPAAAKTPNLCGDTAPSFRGDRLQSLLDETGCSHAKFAKIAGLSQPQISAWVRGDIKTPKMRNVETLAEMFDCPVTYLTGETDRRMKWGHGGARHSAGKPKKGETLIEDSHGQEIVAHA